MAPAQKVNLVNSVHVIHDSLPIHWRGGEGSRESSSSRIFMSPKDANATTTTALDLERQYNVCEHFLTVMIS